MEFEDLMQAVLAAEYPNELEVILKNALYDAWMDGAYDTVEDYRILGYPEFDCPWENV